MPEQQLPEPLVAAGVDLRDFAFMPLDVLRLRDSDLACVEDAEVFRCAVLSWCVAWHQVPAASLPDDDALLARLLGFGRDVKGWKRVRAAGGMRGWVLCADGRLYHPVVAEKARDVWTAKLAQRARTEAARKAREEARQKQSKGNSQSLSQPLSQTHEVSVTDDVTESKGQGQGQGQGDLNKEAYASVGEGADVPGLPRCQADAVVALYHEVLPELPRVRLMGEARRKAIGKWWRWVLTSRKSDGQRRAETADQALSWMRNYFDRARDNDFVMGRTRPAPGHEGWKCDLDFLMTEKGMRQVIEKTAEAA